MTPTLAARIAQLRIRYDTGKQRTAFELQVLGSSALRDMRILLDEVESLQRQLEGTEQDAKIRDEKR